MSRGLEHVDVYWRKSTTISLHFLGFSFILRSREYLFTLDAILMVNWGCPRAFEVSMG